MLPTLKQLKPHLTESWETVGDVKSVNRYTFMLNGKLFIGSFALNVLVRQCDDLGEDR